MRNDGREFSLTVRLWLISAVLLMLLAGFFALKLFVDYRHLETEYSQQVGESLEMLTPALGYLMSGEGAGDFHTFLSALERNPNLLFLMVTDSLSSPVYRFREERMGQAAHQFAARDIFQQKSEDYLLISRSVFHQGRYQGRIIAGYQWRPVQSGFRAVARPTLIGLGALSVILILITAAFSYRISRPFRQAAQALSGFKLESQGFDLRLPEQGGKELAVLAGAFNRLAGQVDQRLARQENYDAFLDAFFRLSTIPILMADFSGKVEKANRSAADLFAMPLEELEGSTLQTLLGEKDFNIISNHVAAAEVDVNGYVTAVRGAGGEKKILELNLTTIRDSSYGFEGFIIVPLDVTDKIHTQREILENQIHLANINRQLFQKTETLEMANRKDKRNGRRLARLIKISNEVIRCDSAEAVLDLVSTGGRELLEADGCRLFLWNSERSCLLPGTPDNLQPEADAPGIEESDGLVWRTYADNKPYFLSGDSLQPLDFEHLGVEPQGIRSLISVPISDHDVHFGVAVYFQRQADSLSLEDLHLMTALTHQAATTLDKISLVQALQEKARHLEEINVDLQHSQQQVVHLQKMESLGTLVGGIAHDFNNILGIITPNIDLLRLKMSGNPEVEKRTGIIQEAADRASGLTRQLLLFSRNQEVELVPLKPNNLIESVVSMLEHTLGSSIEVRTDLDPTIPNISADKTRLTQVLMNLAMNARDAMPGGGIIRITTRTAEYLPPGALDIPYQKYVQIIVSDTGSGIAEEHLDKIFDPFFTTKGMGKGSGLGLSVVYGIVNSHNGYIEVSSEQGKGARFTLYFPPTEEEVLEAETPEEEPLPVTDSDPGRILVVDDEELIRESLRDALESLGYSVLIARNGEEAIDMVRRRKNIHAAIVDLSMPGKNGVETAGDIHRVNADVKILLSSGYADQEELIREHTGISGFLPKPFHIHELARITQQVLQNNAEMFDPFS